MTSKKESTESQNNCRGNIISAKNVSLFMRTRAFSVTVLFLASILSIWINGAFIEEPTSTEIAESPIQYESQGQYTWQFVFDTEPLGAEPYWSPMNPSIAIDSYDGVWVTFDELDALYLAQGNNPQVAEEIDSDLDPEKSSLAVNSSGWPHVSYYDIYYGELKYATKDPITNQWLITTVDGSGIGDVGDSNAIVLDSNDQPHISYIDSTNNDLKYASYDGSVWQNTTLDTSLFGERFEMDSTSIAIDSNDYVHISYSNNSASYNSLKYIHDGPQGWTNTSLTTPNYGGLWSDIAIDSNDDVHISYSDDYHETLEYFTNIGGAWVNSTIDGYSINVNAEINSETSIAINSSGIPHISYYDGAYSGALMHATIDNGGSWSTTIVDDSGEAGIHSSIAIDSSDSVHISYIDDSNYSAKRAIAYNVIQTVQPPSGFQVGHANQNVTMSVGYSHACAILENNTMTCWGSGRDGSSGLGHDGYNLDPHFATAWPANEVASVSAGYHITCAILTNASTYCLGNGTYGQLGNGEGDGTTWIERETIQYVDFGPGRTAVAIEAAKLDTSCALLDNGDVACWGMYADPSNTYANEPYVVDLQNRKAVGIGVGPSSGCAVLEDGGVMCWGDNTAGELGTGTGNYEPTPVNATIWQGHDVVGISVGEYYNCALLRNGSVACGSLSLNNWVGLPADKTAISVSIWNNQYGCVLLSDQSLSCWGHANSVGNQSASGMVSMSNPIPVNISSNLDVLAVDMSTWDNVTACALLSNTEIKCWGSNEKGLLGDANGEPNCNCDELEPTTLVVASLNHNYWYWDSAIAPFAADDRDRDSDGVLNIFDKCLDTPVGSTVDQDGCSTTSLSWTTTHITSTDGTYDADFTSEIVVDSNDNPHISFWDWNTSDVIYANNTGGIWSPSQVTGDSPAPSYSMDIDSNDDIHFALFDSSVLWHRKVSGPYNGSQNVASSSTGNIDHISLFVDSQGVAHMSYYVIPSAQNDGCLYYATSNVSSGTVWMTNTGSCGDVGKYSDIFVDSAGTIHIAHFDETNSAVIYTWRQTGGNWHSTTIDTFNYSGPGYDISIAVDSNNDVWISYDDWEEDELKIATDASGTWTIDTIDYVFSKASDIAIDSTDNIHVSYRDGSNTSLKYATLDRHVSGDNWEIYTVDSNGTLGYANSIAIDSNDYIHISYVNYSSSAVKYATNAPSTGTQLDDDSDGVDNSADLCPNTPAGETVDLDGCSDSQLDDDGDGVMNDADQCPNTSPGASVDADGCALGQGDADGDGVSDLIDDCANTPAGETVDIYGCSDSQLDDDEDGVMNDADQCPGTAAGASVNSDGCSISQLDADGDGVSDLLDACPNTPAGEAVDIYGCSNSQLDDDGDGVMNNADQCSNTPVGETVDVNGCSDSQLDDDGDSVMNNADQCPNTPAGESVDANGCSGSQLDDDSDGVMNSVDQCPNTPPGETVDAVGCAPSQYDGDGDGVPDQSDQCPNTPSGVNVGADGCNYSPTCNVSYDDGAGNIVSLESELSMGTGSSSSSLSLPTGTYQFIVECTDPESDMLSMTVTLDGGSAMTFAGSPLSTGAISVPVQDGMSISKTITYYWTDGLNYGSYEIEVSLIGDDSSDPDDGWLPGFEVWITLLAIIASLFFNRTRRII